MKLQIFSHWRATLVALGVLAGMSVPATAAPFAARLDRSVVAPAVQVQPESVDYRKRRYCGRNGYCGGWKNNYRRHHRHRHYGRRYDRRYYGRVYPRLYLGPAYPTYRYVQPRRYYRGGGSAHVAWCYNRYRSYRAWDNTFQPYHGPRRQCWSPYS